MLGNMRDYTFDDYQEVCRWFRDRGMTTPKPSDLPLTGKIIPFVAVGFLLKTDTTACVLDFFVTNKDANMMARGRAIDTITRALILEAKKLGFKRVRCDSRIDTIKKKAVSLGFRSSGDHTVFCKEI